MFHKELKLVQDKVLMDKFWESYWYLQIEANLVLMKYQGWFYIVDQLRLLVLVIFRVQSLGIVSLSVIQK